MKEIKEVLHLYLGCEVMVQRNETTEWHQGYVAEVTRKSNHGDWVKVRFDECIEVYGHNSMEKSLSNFHTYFLSEDGIKPLLRKLGDMTEEEADYFAWLCMNSEYHLELDCRVSQDEIQIELVKNDDGTLLDNDVEVYIGVSARCFEGGIAIKKDGSIVLEDEGGKVQSLDNIADKVVWLLSKHFDLFGLIKSGLAIDATTLNK